MHKIYIDRLRDGCVEKTEYELPPSVLELDESDLSFPEPVKVAIKAYLSEEHLVLHIDAKTAYKTPCVVCNDEAVQEIVVKNHHYTLPLEEITVIFDYLPLVREVILLEVRPYNECRGGSCPERKNIHSYLKKNDYVSKSDANYPFANLN